MITLFKKEVFSFLNSLIGYIVMVVFITIIGLFMWVFPGDFNIFEGGYANIDTLFIIAPWVFMFLAPAITMRSFADEYKVGTIELLLTKPLSDWQIILGKYLAGAALILFSLLPTLIYYISVKDLASPVGNVDEGAIWGSYLGLLFLSTAFVSIGVFASSLSSNQIVSFIIGVFLSFFMYIGFESIAGLQLFGPLDLLIINFGINEHYISMSRGVIDTRDVLYFLTLIYFFLLLTKFRLSSRRW